MGLGLIVGIAIISIMIQINYMFYPADDLFVNGTSSDFVTEYFSNPPFLIGQIVSVLTGTFFSAAIAKLVKHELTFWNAIIIGTVLMLVGLLDIFSSPYPLYIKLIIPIIYIPAALLGFQFIKNIQ